MLALKSRLYAFSWHLLVSCTIAALAALVVFYSWYPDLLAQASGVTEIFLLLIAVDVAIGPLITLIVFDKKKKELKRDMAIVGMLQLTALIYGMHAVFVARPVFIAYNSSRFDLVYANDLTKERLDKVKHDEFKRLPMFGPVVIASPLPEDPVTAKEIVLSAITTGDDVQYRPEFYEHYSGDARDDARPMDELTQMNSNKKAQIDSLIQKYKQSGRDIGFLPLTTKTEPLTVILDKKTGEVLEITLLRSMSSPKKYRMPNNLASDSN